MTCQVPQTIACLISEEPIPEVLVHLVQSRSNGSDPTNVLISAIELFIILTYLVNIYTQSPRTKHLEPDDLL